MKYVNSLLLGITLFIIGMMITSSSQTPNIKPNLNTVHTSPSPHNTKLTRRDDVHKFMKKLGSIEGLGSYNTVSKSGYLGLYQFHPKTLRAIGLKVSTKEFLKNPRLQDSVMIVYMKSNARELRGIIRKYSGKTYNGVYVTKAGILAGAHLVGTGGMLAFFYPDKYDYRIVDGNGIHVSRYMTQFAKYDLRGL